MKKAECDFDLEEIARTTFRLGEDEGHSKVVSLKEAISSYIRPGIKLHLGFEAGAATCEIIRQFWGSRPEFELIVGGISGTHAVNLLHAGFVKKLVFTTNLDWHPRPRPNPVIQRLYQAGSLELENWSVLSLTQRLLAGALGIGFMPTRSIVGTDMAKENEPFRLIKDPFGTGKTLGVVQALNPDVSVVHGWAADRHGNTIVAPWGYTYMWGAKASRNVVVTVEQIVPESFIREHASAVQIPASIVDAVSVAPFGAHPQGMIIRGIPSLEPYVQDADFLKVHGEASQNPEKLDSWIKYWILDCPTHSAYLDKLGQSKLKLLKEKADENYWETGLSAALKTISTDPHYGSTEMMIVAAAREISATATANGYKTIFAGIGLSGLATSLAYYLLKESNYYVQLLGPGIDYVPRPGCPNLADFGNVWTSKMLTDRLNVHGAAASGKYNRCLGVVSAGQVDKHGRINSSKIGNGTYLAGAGGLGDLAGGAQEIIIVARQSPKRFRDKVDYVTSPGNKVKTLISDYGVLRKTATAGEFKLTAYYQDQGGLNVKERVQRIKENCGWPLRVSRSLTEILPPTRRELVILRMLDYKGEFLTGD